MHIDVPKLSWPNSLSLSRVEASATTPAAPRKRAPKKQPAAKPRGGSAKGKAKASAPTPKPVEEAPVAVPALPPKGIEEYDALTNSIMELNRTALADARVIRAPETPPRPLFGFNGYNSLGPTFNFFEPAFRLVCGQHPFFDEVRTQPEPSSDSTASDREESVQRTDQAGPSQPAQSQASLEPDMVDDDDDFDDDLDDVDDDDDDLNYDPVVFPSVPESTEEVRTVHPFPGATLITRQNAYIFDNLGRPLPTGRGEPDSVPDPIGDKVAALLKASREPPYPSTWHGPMFEQEVVLADPAKAPRPGMLRRHNAVNLGYPEGCEPTRTETGESSSAPTAPRGAPLTRQYAVNWGYPEGCEPTKAGEPSSAPTAPRRAPLTRQYAVNLGYPEGCEPAKAVAAPSSVAAPIPARLTRQDAINLGRPRDRDVAEAGPSTVAQTRTDHGTVATRRSLAPPIAPITFEDLYGMEIEVAPHVDAEVEVQIVEGVAPVQPVQPVEEQRSPEEIARRERLRKLREEHKLPPLRRQSHVYLQMLAQLQAQEEEEEEATVVAEAHSSNEHGPSTAPRPRPRPGSELRRHNAVFIGKDGREIPIGAEDDPSNNGSLSTVGLHANRALQRMEAQSQDAPTVSAPTAGPSGVRAPSSRSATPVPPAATSKVAALSRTSSQNNLGLLGSPRKGKAVPFSRQGSQASLGAKASALSRQTSLSSLRESAEATRLDKGKGRALPEPEPELEDRPPDKGKKRAREDDDDSEEHSSETSEGDLDEVEDSLVIDLEDEAEEDDEEYDDLSDWPRNYVLHQGLFRIEVSTLPMPYLPVAQVPQDGKPFLRYTGPVDVPPPNLLYNGTKRARDEDNEVPEETAPPAKKARVTVQ